MSSLSVIAKNLYKFSTNGDGVLTILDNVSLDASPSSITALIGPSGAGKSTLLRCLNGLDRIDSGKIEITSGERPDDIIDAKKTIDEYISQGNQTFLNNSTILISQLGVELYNPRLDKAKRILAKDADEKLKRIAMIFQAYTLVSQKTVLQNVCLPFALQGIKITDEHKKKALSLLNEVGIADKANSYPSELSGGQRQRVAIARALISNPGLLLCDELTSALDSKTTFEILSLLKRVNKKYGITIIIVTHDIDVVKYIADTVCVMDKGQIVEQGSVIDVLITPKHDVTQNLINATSGGALPSFIKDRIQQHQTDITDMVLKLIFTKESSTKPIIASVATAFGVHFSIIAGSLDNISNQKENYLFGHLWVSCPSTNKMNAAKQYMMDHGVDVETLGYISWE